MPAPGPARTLPEGLQTKAIAVRLQLEAFDRELLVAQLQARIAMLERQALTANLPALEQQCLEALGAPAGARFNWQTLSFDPPPETSPV
jgi:hypothetical protein